MKKRILTISLALLIAVAALAGCQTQDTAWAYSYNGHSMPAGLYISFLMDTYVQAMARLQEAGGYELNMAYKDSIAKPLEEGTVSDWMVNRARELVSEYYAVYNKMAEMGLALDEDAKAQARQTAIDVMNQRGDLYRGNGISENSLALAVEYQMARRQLFTALYGEGGLYAVPEEEYISLLQTQYVKAKMLVLNKPASFDLTEEEMQNEEAALAARDVLVKEKADGYLQRLVAGETTIDELYVEYSTELAALDAEINNTEPVPVEPPGPDDLIFIANINEAAYYGEEVISGLFAAEVGKPFMTESEDNYLLFDRLDIAGDLPTYREELLPQLRDAAFNELVAEWGAAVAPSPNEAAVARYRPEDIKAA